MRHERNKIQMCKSYRLLEVVTLTKVVLAGFCLLLLAVLPLQAAGLLKPVGTADADHVFMKSHHVTVTINNGFARTEVEQVFGNEGETDLKAIYSFPVPKQASLAEVSLWINSNEVIGEVLEKKKARQIHEDQAQKGNDTALAVKDEYKTFEITVYPVRSKADTRVRLVYYQPMEIDSNIGRYVYPLAEGGVDEDRIAFWSVDDKVRESFKFDLELKSAFPVKEVRMPGFMNKAVIEKVPFSDQEELPAGDVYRASLNCPEGDALTRDIVVYYRLDENVPARVELIPYRGDPASEGTFMVVVTPAADLKRIAEGVNWTFVLDVSGSMSGGKIAALTDGVSKVIGKMSVNDRFRIITFNNRASDFTGGYVTATPANVQSLLNQVKAIQAGGCTNLFEGLEMAYHGLEEERTTAIILVTDGEANEGPTTHLEFLNLLKTYDIRLFTFVIGNSANQPLLNRLAMDSGGTAMNISTSDDIVGRIIQAKAKLLYENMHDVELKFHGEKVTGLTPTKIGNLYQGQQLVMFGRYNGTGDVKVELKAKISGQERSWICRADLPRQDTDNPELERLWALSAIDDVMRDIRENGETDRRRDQVVALGEEYSLVTDYTSMLVVSEVAMEEHQVQRRNATRVAIERQARQQRKTKPVKSYRVDKRYTPPTNDSSSAGSGSSQDTSTWGGRSSPGINFGTGPVGPAFIMLAMWLKRKKRHQ